MDPASQKQYFRRMATIALAVALPMQGLLLVPLLFVSEMGNFDFLGYILVTGLSVLNWIFIFWRTIHLGKTTRYEVEGETLTLWRGFIRTERVVIDLPAVNALEEKTVFHQKDALLTLNSRAFTLPCVSDAFFDLLTQKITGVAAESALPATENDTTTERAAKEAQDDRI